MVSISVGVRNRVWLVNVFTRFFEFFNEGWAASRGYTLKMETGGLMQRATGPLSPFRRAWMRDLCRMKYDTNEE